MSHMHPRHTHPEVWHSWVGRKVVKASGKPFKSGAKVATVTAVAVHDHTTHLAFRFAEDASSVECFRCRLAQVEDVIDHGTVGKDAT